MKVSELIALLENCDPEATVNYVSDEGYFLDVEFVENRLSSTNGWSATVSLYDGQPDYSTGFSEDYEVEVISQDSVFATTKYHDFVVSQ